MGHHRMTDTTGVEAETTASHEALPETILKVENLGVEFWVEGEFYPAAIDMNYEVRRGEVLAIVGESGSGKSTSSMSLLGLLPENARVTGSIKLLGRELRGADPVTLRSLRGNEIAVIFQEPMTALNPVYTIGFQIMESLRSHDRSLSPTIAKEKAVDLLRNLHKRLDSAIILITHDMGVVADLADRIMVMKNGVVVESGAVDQIFHDPQHPYTQQLLASVPHLGLGVLETEASVTDEVVTAT